MRVNPQAEVVENSPVPKEHDPPVGRERFVAVYRVAILNRQGPPRDLPHSRELSDAFPPRGEVRVALLGMQVGEPARSGPEQTQRAGHAPCALDCPVPSSPLDAHRRQRRAAVAPACERMRHQPHLSARFGSGAARVRWPRRCRLLGRPELFRREHHSLGSGPRTLLSRSDSAACMERPRSVRASQTKTINVQLLIGALSRRASA